MFSDIMDIYQAQTQWAEAEAFFLAAYCPQHRLSPRLRSFLHMYLAILNMQLKRPQVARPQFLAAQTQLRRVVKPENELFQVIDKLGREQALAGCAPIEKHGDSPQINSFCTGTNPGPAAGWQ